MLEAIGGGDVRVVPVHHPDAGREPDQEDDAERDAEPAMDKDGGTRDKRDDSPSHRHRQYRRAERPTTEEILNTRDYFLASIAVRRRSSLARSSGVNSSP